MTWADASQQVVESYQTVSLWCFEHQVETDIIFVVLAFIAINELYSVIRGKQRRTRRRLHRQIWGSWMNRKSRLSLQRMRFEDAITDASYEMLHYGEMTDEEQKKWFSLFDIGYEFTGMRPAKKSVESLKQAINKRVDKLQLSKTPKIPGDKPADPSKPDPEGLSGSKYLKG